MRNRALIARWVLAHTNPEAPEVEIVGRPKDAEENFGDAPVFNIDENPVVDLTGVKVEAGKSFAFTVESRRKGDFSYTLTASSNAGEVAQMAVTFFSLGAPRGTHTYQGSAGQDMDRSGSFDIISRYSPCRLYFAKSGLDLKKISFEFREENKKFS